MCGIEFKMIKIILLIPGYSSKKFKIPKRTSSNQINSITDLNVLDRIVVDKSNQKRADAKKGRKNRHYT